MEELWKERKDLFQRVKWVILKGGSMIVGLYVYENLFASLNIWISVSNLTYTFFFFKLFCILKARDIHARNSKGFDKFEIFRQMTQVFDGCRKFSTTSQVSKSHFMFRTIYAISNHRKVQFLKKLIRL